MIKGRFQGPLHASLLCGGLFIAAPVAAQDVVSIEQIRVTGRPPAADIRTRSQLQESSYLLGASSASGLQTFTAPSVVGPSASQARSIQNGLGNNATVDMAGAMNTALQTVTGNFNTVDQMQNGTANTSSVTVWGDANTIGTRQSGSGASATITVRGDANTITVQQQGIAPLPVSVTQVGNGGTVVISRR